jgi:nitrate/TMAO reductase-like tetraheme cytochrome c subunit
VDGTTECIRCHTTGLWKIREFDHNTKTAFKLEGKHAEIACTDCHKPAQRGSDIFILYKIGDSRCEHCH